MIGTRGVPARYGGFETAVEEVGRRLVQLGSEVTVYCRNPGQTIRTFEGMDLVNLAALRRKSLETLSHTGISCAHAAWHKPDCAFVFNCANAPFVPILRARGIPTAVHVDGLEWKRAKWGPVGKRYYRLAERLAVRVADALIADAKGIQSYLRNEHGAHSWFIPYGAPRGTTAPASLLDRVGVAAREFHLVVARLEPENHVHLIVDGYRASDARHPLVIVGDAPYASRYRTSLIASATSDARIRLVGSVWDQALLDSLYAHSLTYVHGHSVGGTNPSLLRAMGASAPVIAFDCIFNREVTDGAALGYFERAKDVASAIERAEADEARCYEAGRQLGAHVRRAYDWDDVAAGYLALARDLVAQPRRRRASAPHRGVPT